MNALATKAPMRFPLTEGDIALFCHPAEGHPYHRPHMIEGNLHAGNGHIAIRATSGRWMESDFQPAPEPFKTRIGGLPWGAIHADSPEWRSLDEVRGTIYKYAPITIWTDKGKRAPSPVVSIGGHHLIRLSHLQLIARLPRCEAYAGAVTRHQCAGHFWAAVPREHWPEDRTHIDRVWKGNNGDCRQEIVLIGRNMNREALTAMFDACLLSEGELAENQRNWPKLYADPFPKWEMGVKAF